MKNRMNPSVERSNLKRRTKVKRNQESPAYCSILPTREDSLFLRQNDYWIIRYRGHTAFLKSTRGLDCLAILLRNSGREFHVRELLARPLDASTLTTAVAMHGHVIGGLSAGVPVLDTEVKVACKCRLN